MRRFQPAERGDKTLILAGQRLSTLQKRILCWLERDERRTRGSRSSSHQELVQVLPHAKGNISHSLRLLEARGLLIIGRSPGGQAEYVVLTAEGRQKVAEVARSYD
jgi:DNA-binding MarR family transcriptional regulator